LITKIFKAVAPFLLSISASFAFIYSWGSFNGFPLGWKLVDGDGFQDVDIQRLKNWTEAFNLSNIIPFNMMDMDFTFTWEMKFYTELSTLAMDAASYVAKSAYRTGLAVKEYFQSAA
jgi:hypothetical protein